MEKLKVIFRKIDSEIIAFFPEIAVRSGYIMSYMHIGQHSEASIGFYYETKIATAEEYTPLLEELKGVYNDCELIVRQRINHNDLHNAWKF